MFDASALHAERPNFHSSLVNGDEPPQSLFTRPEHLDLGPVASAGSFSYRRETEYGQRINSMTSAANANRFKFRVWELLKPAPVASDLWLAHREAWRISTRGARADAGEGRGGLRRGGGVVTCRRVPAVPSCWSRGVICCCSSGAFDMSERLFALVRSLVGFVRGPFN